MHVRSTPSPLCGLHRASPPAMPHIVYPKATGLLSPSTSCVGENPIGPSRTKQHLLYTSFFLSPVLRAYRRLSERCASVITMVALSKRARRRCFTLRSPHLTSLFTPTQVLASSRPRRSVIDSSHKAPAVAPPPRASAAMPRAASSP
jgi:hypothetical protein